MAREAQGEFAHLQVVRTNRKVSVGKIGGVNETVLLSWRKDLLRCS